MGKENEPSYAKPKHKLYEKGLKNPPAHFYLFMVFNQDFHNNVLELQVHDGCHSLLLWPHQSRSEHHAQVGHSHEVLLGVIGNAANGEQREACGEGVGTM